MTMNLYTFFMEFEGGTYISQVAAPSLKLAMRKWANSLDTTQIKGMGPTLKKQVIQEIEGEEATPLEGLKNAWCFALSPKGKFCLVNFVETRAPSRFEERPIPRPN